MHDVKLQHQPEHQISLFGYSPLLDALDQLAEAGTEERGAVFTKPEVVNFILDLVDYVWVLQDSHATGWSSLTASVVVKRVPSTAQSIG